HLNAADKPLTIFTERYYPVPLSTDSDALLEKWTAIRAIRSEVMREIEHVRSKGQIGSSLAAQLSIVAAGQDYELLKSLRDNLRFAFIVSAAQVQQGSNDEIQISVTPSTDDKCERCWHHEPSVGQDTQHSTLCARCVTNIVGNGEQRFFL